MKIALENFYGKLKMVYESADLEIPRLEIHIDKDENVCLTDLWRLAGGDIDKRPNDWLNLDNTISFIEGVASVLNTALDGIIKSKRGKGGGTFAHKQVALSYAKYLSPELHVLVNEVFFERLEEQNNPEAAVDRAVKDWKKQGRTDDWINTRLRSKAQRSEFTSILSQHRVINNGTHDNGFRRCTNAIYSPLFGGDAQSIKQKKNLPNKANIRDNLGATELAALMLAEALSAENIKIKKAFGNDECESECRSASVNVAKAVTNTRSTQPRKIG
ncbi:KilA-N domain-containing protein [Pontibacter populi]|uniref:KilA-N domain-containing protein n=1 Tax=Pontibacter populi TaxID=890055 RepID=A0ABV1RP62_9BACT